MNNNKKTTYESKNYIIFFGKIFIAYRPESKDIVFRHFIGGWRGGGEVGGSRGGGIKRAAGRNILRMDGISKKLRIS